MLIESYHTLGETHLLLAVHVNDLFRFGVHCTLCDHLSLRELPLNEQFVINRKALGCKVVALLISFGVGMGSRL